MFQGKLWKFCNMIRSSMPTKRISRIFYIGDLRSGHFCDLPVNEQKINSVIFTLAQAYLSGIISYRTVVGNSNKICIAYPSKGHLRSPEVTNSHLPITFDQKEVEDVGLVSVRSSRPGESTDMQYDPFRSPRDLDLTTWGQTLTLTFQGHFIYGSTRLNDTNTMVSKSLLYL